MILGPGVGEQINPKVAWGRRKELQTDHWMHNHVQFLTSLLSACPGSATVSSFLLLQFTKFSPIASLWHLLYLLPKYFKLCSFIAASFSFLGGWSTQLSPSRKPPTSSSSEWALSSAFNLNISNSVLNTTAIPSHSPLHFPYYFHHYLEQLLAFVIYVCLFGWFFYHSRFGSQVEYGLSKFYKTRPIFSRLDLGGENGVFGWYVQRKSFIFSVTFWWVSVQHSKDIQISLKDAVFCGRVDYYSG